MKTPFLFLLLVSFFSCNKSSIVDPLSISSLPVPLDTRDGYYLTHGTFDLGAETLLVNGRSGQLPQICNLAVYYRPHQFVTKHGGWYPVIFFLYKDVYPNQNPDHYLFTVGFQLEFLTDEPCGDYFDLLDYYTGTWDNQHAFLAAIVHPRTADCWVEGSFSFTIASNFPLSCSDAVSLPQETKRAATSVSLSRKD